MTDIKKDYYGTPYQTPDGKPPVAGTQVQITTPTGATVQGTWKDGVAIPDKQ